MFPIAKLLYFLMTVAILVFVIVIWVQMPKKPKILQQQNISQCYDSLRSDPSSPCYGVGPNAGCYNKKCQQQIYQECCGGSGSKNACMEKHCGHS
jgi:hypothetical protein